MTIADELRERASFLESGTLRWTSGGPLAGECCLVADRVDLELEFVFSDDAEKWLDTYTCCLFGMHAVNWNDYHCKDVTEAIAVLRAAADAWEATCD